MKPRLFQTFVRVAVLVTITPLLLGTTFILKEDGKEVGQYSEQDGSNQVRIIESSKSPVAKKKSPSSAGGATFQSFSPALPIAGMVPPAAKLALPDVMRAVTFIKTYKRSGKPLGSGSGVLINSHGTMLTNWHVVSGAGKIKVALYTGKRKNKNRPEYEYEARVLKWDPFYDLAIIDIHSETPYFLRFADENDIVVGNEVQAIGNPQGFQVTVSKGIVSAIRRNEDMDAQYRSIGKRSMSERMFDNITWIQTDAALNPGNSGGPLLNKQHQIIGINTASYQFLDGLSFALHAKHAKKFAAGYREKKS